MKENNKKLIDKFSVKEVVIMLIAISVVSLVAGFAIANRTLKYTNDTYLNHFSTNLKTFINNYNYIVDNYYGEIDENELLDSALAGVLRALGDPYTSYIDESELSDFDMKLEGTYQGLGIEIYSNGDGKLEVSSVFESSPAEKAGILPGDLIIKLDGEDVNGADSSTFANKVKNDNNTTFNLTLDRNGEILDITLSRGKIDIISVSSNIFEKENKKIGYLAISVFANNTYEQMKQKLEELEEHGIDSLIIDVRDNTGGHLTSVENILGLFLDRTHVIYKTKDSTGIETVYSSGKVTKDYPIIVLTNELSASASEILTAALKEEYGAKSVGKKTYGKGTAQELRTLPDGTKYKFTTKQWLTPKGDSIDEVGVDVDVSINLSKEYYTNPVEANDNQLQAAIDILLQ